MSYVKLYLRSLWPRLTSTRPYHERFFKLPDQKLSPKYYKPEPLLVHPNYTASIPLRIKGGKSGQVKTWSPASKIAPSYFVVPILYHDIPSLKRISNDSGAATNQIDPLLFRTRGNLPLPLFLLKKRKRSKGMKQIQPLIKKRGLITCSSYPQCFALSDKVWPLLGRYLPSFKAKNQWKRELKKSNVGRPVDVPYWPLLGAVRSISTKDQTINGSEVSLVAVLDSKKNWEMDLVRRISEMKAKEHVAEENRLTQLHKTQEAKHEFQDRISEQLNLLSDAKRADLRAKEAFKKVVGFERGLADQDKEIHRLKEAQDELYEELLESEAEVAMADMNVIPKLVSEEELQGFLSGTRFSDRETLALKPL